MKLLTIFVGLLIFATGLITGFIIKKDAIQIHYVEKISEVVKEVKLEPNYEVFEITAYTAGFESTGKNPDDAGYGVTASGEYVLEGRTIACPKSMKFGTGIYIPAFENVYYCTDRGSDITEGKLDIYMENLEDALTFGRKNLRVFVLP